MSDTGESVLEAEPKRPRRNITRLPALTRRAFGIAWAAAPRDLVGTAVLQFVAAIGLTAQVLITRELLTSIFEIEDGAQFGSVMPWIIALTSIQATITLLGLVRVERQRIMGELVGRLAMDEVLESATTCDLISYETPEFHDRLTRAQTNAMSSPMQMVNGLVNLLGAIISGLGLAIALFVVAPEFLVILLVGYVPLLLATRRASRINYRFSVEQTHRDRRRGYLQFVLTARESAAETRAYEVGPPFRTRWSNMWDERIVDLRRALRSRLLVTMAGSFATAVINAAALATLVWFVTSGRISLADAGAAATAMILLAQRLRGVAGGTSALYESSLFIEDFTDFVQERRDQRVRVAGGAETAPASLAPFGTLTVEGLSFTYPSRAEPALSDVSFTIEQGQVVALVGENGSGKSTLAKLLSGLYRPPAGTVHWDRHDLGAIDQRMVRESVGVIFQDYLKYMMTARDNIVNGRITVESDDARMVEAARRSSAASYLEALRDGYGTQLGSEYFGGSELSIGQWQRVALARAFYRDAPFLILDEPSAALDPRSEAQLFDRIRELYAGRTVLLISHRFSTVRSADRILVLSGGTLLENGTHEELMRADQLYAELFNLQASAFLDG